MPLSKSTSIPFNGIGGIFNPAYIINFTASIQDVNRPAEPVNIRSFLIEKYAIMDRESILKANSCCETEEPPHIMRVASSFSI